MTENEVRAAYVRQIRYAGESLIKNAESIVGSEKYLSTLRIAIVIDPDDCIPEIDIHRSFYPEKFIEENSHVKQ